MLGVGFRKRVIEEKEQRIRQCRSRKIDIERKKK
jgi:hypothetical protein